MYQHFRDVFLSFGIPLIDIYVKHNVLHVLVSGLTGAMLIYTFTPPKFRGALGVLSLHPDLTPQFGFVIEVLITFQLIWTATASKDPIRKFTGFQAPFAIGMSVTIGLMTGVRLSLYH